MHPFVFIKRPSGCEERPLSCEEHPSGCEERPLSCEEHPSGCEKRPSGCEERPLSCEERPSSCEERPLSCEERRFPSRDILAQILKSQFTHPNPPLPSYTKPPPFALHRPTSSFPPPLFPSGQTFRQCPCNVASRKSNRPWHPRPKNLF